VSDVAVAGPQPTSLGIQIVLFDDDFESLLRLASSIGACANAVRSATSVERIEVRVGDCSRWPCLDDDAERVLREAVERDADGAVGGIRFRFFAANLGSAGGSNALAADGVDDAIWVLNPDTYPSPAAATELLAAISGDGVGAADARQIPVEHPKSYDRTTGETSWASGFSLMVRRHAFDAVGGFDDHFFPLYCDDVDLSWRLRLAGWSIRHVPSAVVFHDKEIGPRGPIGWSPEAARASHLGRLWLYRRYGRPDLERAFVEGLDRVADPVAASAIDEYRTRVSRGDAPDTLPGAANVATFGGGQFAPRRFAYAT
jgi:GT2 family glycosyltransferase